MDNKLFTGMMIGILLASTVCISVLAFVPNQDEINRILNEPLVVESVTRYVEKIDDNFSEEVFIWTVCNVKCYELRRDRDIAVGAELEVKR